MLEIVDAFLGADGGKKFGDRAPKFGCNAADFAHLESVANTQIEHPNFFSDLAQEGLPGFGNCVWNLLQTANTGRIALYGTICPYLFPRIGGAGKCSSVLQPWARHCWWV
jgi:hypothetical protein